ncbi:MAG: M4 family metallopeptidase [Cyanobacteria bacterium P01_D01_bin.105]
MSFKAFHSPTCLCCILSPDILDAIKRNGDARQRREAEATEELTQRLRATRLTASPRRVTAAPNVATSTTKGPTRLVFDSKGTRSLQENLVRSEGDGPTGDQQVDEAYDGAGATYELFLNEYGRDSLDGNGMALISNVHYGKDFENAFWDGEQMAYGDGGSVFKPLTGDLAIIGHEFSHGVTQFSGGLEYQDQAGSLNEHFSDVFGSLTKQYALKQTALEADWLMGADVLQPDVNGIALRSMKAPGEAYNDSLIGKDPQPYHMDYFVFTSRNNGGVHINSGIPNYAFYMLCVMLGGYAWEGPGQIWYKTMQDISNPFATFTEWANLTVLNAEELYGRGSLEAIYTKRCWKLVGIEL